MKYRIFKGLNHYGGPSYIVMARRCWPLRWQEIRNFGLHSLEAAREAVALDIDDRIRRKLKPQLIEEIDSAH